jgi:hypothetical protein
MRKHIRFVYITALSAVLLLLTAQGLYAATITVSNVNDNGAGSLRAALAGAGSSDTIIFSVSGTITLTSGQLVVDKNVTIAGPGSSVLSVSGNAASRVFYISPGTTAAISGLTITNGRTFFTSETEVSCGAGILNDRGTLTVTRSTVTGNTATNERGNGICNEGPATMTIIESTVSGNPGEGGAIYNESPVSGDALMTIISSTVSGNGGGGILNDGSGYIVGSGTGTGSPSSTIILTNSTISGNNGPGIANIGGAYFTRNGTRFTGSVSLSVTNSTISRNQGYCSLADSIAVIVTNGVKSNVTIGNTILNAEIGSRNISSDAYDDGTSTITSLGHNLSSDGAGGFFTGTGDLINTNALLGDLQHNGGPTFTQALLDGSPAVDAGDPAFAAPPAYDQRGTGFPRVVAGRLDIGAFEVQPVTYPFTGFLSPIAAAPAVSTVNAGSLVPIKFGLGGDRGLDIFAAGSPASQQIDCRTLAPLGGLLPVMSAGGSVLTYKAETDQYTFTWKTEKNWKGTCRQLSVTFNDGTAPRLANFRFK